MNERQFPRKYFAYLFFNFCVNFFEKFTKIEEKNTQYLMSLSSIWADCLLHCASGNNSSAVSMHFIRTRNVFVLLRQNEVAPFVVRLVEEYCAKNVNEVKSYTSFVLFSVEVRNCSGLDKGFLEEPSKLIEIQFRIAFQRFDVLPG